MSGTIHDPGKIAHHRVGERSGAWLWAALLLAGLLLVACEDRDVPAAIDHPPVVDPLPVAMGVYYPPEFRTARCNVKYLTGFMKPLEEAMMRPWSRTVVIGPAQVAAFDLVWPAMFKSVVPLESPPSANAAGGLAGAITVSLDDCSLAVYSGHVRLVSFTYRFTLTSASDDIKATWLVFGAPAGEHDGSGPYLQEALRDAVAKFVAGFDTEPALAAWRAQLSAQGKVP
jgi:hypothetical protein